MKNNLRLEALNKLVLDAEKNLEIVRSQNEEMLKTGVTPVFSYQHALETALDALVAIRNKQAIYAKVEVL